MARSAACWARQGAVLIAGLLAFDSSAAEWPPFRVWGHLGYSYRFDQVEGGNDVMEHSEFLRVNTSTYVWEPWVALFDASLGLEFTQTDEESRERSGTFVSGSARIRLFPFSRFPFEAFVERTQDNIDEDLFGSDAQTTRYGVIQRYNSEGGTGYRFRYEHSERTFDQDNLQLEEIDNDDIAELDLSRSFGNFSIDWNNLYNRHQDEESGDESTRIDSILRHRYFPGPTFSVDGQLSYFTEDFDERGVTRSFDRWELSEYAFWRPETQKPLLVTGALRYIDTTAGIDPFEINARSMTGSLGISYQISPRWQITGDVSATLTETRNGNTTNNFGNLEARYTSDNLELGNFNYNWFGSVGLRYEDDEQDSVISETASLGHDISRTFRIGDSSAVGLRFSQSLSAIEDNLGRSTQLLDHNLSLTWNRQSDSSSTFVGLNASDSRTLGGGGRQGNEDSESQFVNLQISRNQQLGRSSSWSGNLTVQAVRHVDPVDDDSGADDNNGKWQPFASVDLEYQHQRLFGVPRLRFRSTLKLYSDDYLPLLQESDAVDEQRGQVWDNRLEYNIGRLDFLLLGRLSDIDDSMRSLIFFQVRRHFDSLY